MEGPNNTTSRGTGRRTIGQLAGHEIHLEIEDVLDKKSPHLLVLPELNLDF